MITKSASIIRKREIILWDIGKDTLSHDLLKSLCVELCFDEYGIVDTLRRMDKLQSLVVALLAVLNSQKEEKGLVLSTCCFAYLIQWNKEAKESCCTSANMVQMVRLLLSTSVSTFAKTATDPFDTAFARVAVTRLLALNDFRNSSEVHSEVHQFVEKWMVRLQQDIHNQRAQCALQLIASLAQSSLPCVLDYLNRHKDCLRLFVEAVKPSLPINVVFYSLVVANAAKVDNDSIIQTYAAVLCELLPLDKRKRQDLIVLFPLINQLTCALNRQDIHLQLRCNSCFLGLLYSCQAIAEVGILSEHSRRACENLLSELLSYCEAIEERHGQLGSMFDTFLASVPEKRQRALFDEVCAYLHEAQDLHSFANQMASIIEELLITNESAVFVSETPEEFLHTRMPLSLTPIDSDKSSRQSSPSFVTFPRTSLDSRSVVREESPRLTSPLPKKERRDATPQMKQRKSDDWVPNCSSFVTTSHNTLPLWSRVTKRWI